MNIKRVSCSFRLWFCAMLWSLTTCLPGSLPAQWEPPAGYYSGATGTGATLKNQLRSTMSSGHIQRTYGDFRFSAAVHDRDPNNSSRILLVYNRASVPGNWNSGSTWNREHVWPQALQPGSASNGSQGNLGDPHALRPADPAINELRGNRAFGFETTTGSFRTIGANFFPGDQCKGDIARSLFYSATRWSSQGLTLVEGNPSGNQMGDLSSLVAWHFLDPPDEFERRRNHTIYSSDLNPTYHTNNRSAYVDRPEFVWSVFVDQFNDSSISIVGGATGSDGQSILLLDFGRMIVGGPMPDSQTVTLAKGGQDGTYYSIECFDDAVCDVVGASNAFQTGGTDSRDLIVGLDFDAGVPADRNSMIVVDNLDVTIMAGLGQGANDANDFILATIDVLDHANGSFSDSADQDFLEIDLGEVVINEPIPETTFEIHNRASAFGSDLTAALQLNSINADPATGEIEITGPLFAKLAADDSESFSVTGMVDQLGPSSVEFTFELTDEDLPGATGQQLQLVLQFEGVESSVLVGDVNLDGSVDLADIAPFVDRLATGTFQAEADINGDGSVDLSDIPAFVDLLAGS